MKIMIKNIKVDDIKEIKKFLKDTQALELEVIDKKERYKWIQKTLDKFDYVNKGKFEKGLIQKYIIKMSHYSKAQINRLIQEYKKLGVVEWNEYIRNPKKKKYTEEEIKLLAQSDELHGYGNANALKCRLKLMSPMDQRYTNISEISPAYIYKLRRLNSYLKHTQYYSKTTADSSKKATQIARREKPNPQGIPGHLRIDTVHQGDKDKIKGVYHINIICEVTQYEFVMAVPEITSKYILNVLKKAVEYFPFKILGFHSDNGSEYINKFVAKLLNELMIDQTKSRPRKSNDNALIETKNGSIIRKWIGYMFIDKKYTDLLNEFYSGCFNDYLNFHRPCGFSSTKINSKGKEIKFYPLENYKTPYEKLKSLPNSKSYLKDGVCFETLEKKFLIRNCNQQAELVQQQRQIFFDKILSLLP